MGLSGRKKTHHLLYIGISHRASPVKTPSLALATTPFISELHPSPHTPPCAPALAFPHNIIDVESDSDDDRLSDHRSTYFFLNNLNRI